MRPLLGITKNDGKKKPAQYKFCDFQKEGQRNVTRDQDRTAASQNQRNGPLLHCYVLDMARLSAGIIFPVNRNESPRKIYVSSFNFGWDLTQGLILRFRRVRSMHGLNKPTQLKI